MANLYRRIYVLAACAALCGFSASAAKGDKAFSENFDADDALTRWIIVDNNGGRTWEPLRGTAAYMLDYQTGLPGDDWLISPAFNLEAGRVYDLTLYAAAINSKESLRIALGTSSSPDGMTVTLADFPLLENANSGNKSLRIIPEKSGEYYLGFYSYSAPNGNRMEIDNIEIMDAGDALAPGAVDGLKLTAGELGSMTATLSMTAPAITAGGSALTEISRIEVLRNEETSPVHTFTDVVPGTFLEWTDRDVAVNGFNTFKVSAYNTAGNVDVSEATVFVGHDTPLPVSGLVASVNDNRSVDVRWKAPAGSVNSGYLDLGAVVYRVERSDGTLIDGAMTASGFNDARPVAEGQAAVSYTVTAISAQGKEAESVRSNEVTCGEPLKLPYRESFADMKPTVPWTHDPSAHDFDWLLTFDDEEGEVEEVVSADGDNGMISAEVRYADYGDESRYVSPMLDLSGVANPCMSFYFYYARSVWYDPEWDGEINTRLDVQISRNGGEWESLENASFYINESNAGWKRCEVILPKKDGDKFVNIGLLAVSDADDGSYRNIYVDNITVDEAACANDLTLDSFEAEPLRLNVGETGKLTATVFNRGGSSTSIYKVHFMVGDEIFSTVDGREVAPGAKESFSASYTAKLDDAYEESIPVWAKVEYNQDENVDNNVSAKLGMSVRHNDVAAPDGLSGVISGGSVELSWTPLTSVEAVEAGEPDVVTEDFESYTPFITEGIGDWSLYDGDGATTLVTPRIPVSYPHQGEPMAWQVFNVEQSGTWTEGNYDPAFEPVDETGTQYLVCMSADYPAENDDWLISPRLDGRAQQISFRANAATYDAEWMQVLYSTTDNHHDSFRLISSEREYVHGGWRKYTYNLPEDARYFAIRCIRRCVIMMVDDITYAIHDGRQSAAKFLGYNLYRDGKKLNNELLTEAAYIDDKLTSDAHAYRVTGVYEEGESAYSPEFVANTTGIGGVDADTLIVSAGRGFVTLEGNGSYSVVGIDGVVLATGVCEGRRTILLPAGVYIVNQQKVVVR